MRDAGCLRDLDPNATSIVAGRAAILYFAGYRAEGLPDLRDLARQQPQDVGPQRTLAQIAFYEGRSGEFLRETAITARLRSDAAGRTDVERWRSARPNTTAIEGAMCRDAKKAKAKSFQIARLAAVAGQRE